MEHRNPSAPTLGASAGASSASSFADRSRPARVIRTADEVHASARRIPKTMENWQGQEGPIWQVTIMPGGVQLGSKDFNRIEKSTQERIDRALKASLVDDGGMTLEMPAQPTRGRVTSWSAKSRANMVRTLCAIDYSQIAGDDARPALVTLTMPHDWTSIAPTPAHFKKMVNKLRDRYKLAWGHDIAGIWKMEFQFRKQCAAKGCHDPRAPHLHILTAMEPGTAPRPLSVAERAHNRGCRRDICDHSSHVRADLEYREWLSHAWALSVAHPDPDQFAKHLGAGTNVSEEETLRYGDAKRIAVYFTKHGTFSAKDYQNDLPDIWSDAIRLDGEGGANFWGRWVLPVVRATQQIDPTLIMHSTP